MSSKIAQGVEWGADWIGAAPFGIERTKHMTTGRRLGPWPSDSSGRALPQGVCIHHTAGWDAKSGIRAMENRKYSVHVLIERDGKIHLGVPLTQRAVHVGGEWAGRTGLNHWMVGIELVNFGRVDGLAGEGTPGFLVTPEDQNCRELNAGSEVTGYRLWKNRYRVVTRTPIKNGFATYTDDQVEALVWLLTHLCGEFGIRAANVVGHDMVYGPKTDPGPNLPMAEILERIGANQEHLTAAAQSLLHQMGMYEHQIDGVWGPLTERGLFSAIGLHPGYVTWDAYLELVRAFYEWRYDV